jgi:HEAT repeat protein
MNATFRFAFLLRLTTVFLFIFQSGFPSRGDTYDLNAVKGIQAFDGSAAAKELLRQNGFVVADPAFRQIFEAYIKSPQTEEPSQTKPMGQFLPSFITTDSAWHTYHVLLEEGVRQMEEVQAQRLLQFSRRLSGIVAQRNAGPELIEFASVGLALQDEHYRRSLVGQNKRIVDGLRTGTTPVAVRIGFELSPLQFRAQSFYTQSAELSDYFEARQWYASVVFRLDDSQETRLAVELAMLVTADPELSELWNQLSDPYDEFVARADDGTVHEYVTTTTSIAGTNTLGTSLTDKQVTEIQKKLEAQLPMPLINDQLLSPEQYAHFGTVTRGFRLLPPRRLPSSVCFQNTIDPKIPGRMYPSGLDFIAASPILRSPAALRATESQFGEKVSDLVLRVDCGPMPDSLHGEALRLLAKLQEPLPAGSPAPLRTEAWSDLQLWTQLGAWAEQRHTWALHAKISVEYMGIIMPPKGMVAPYPDFFAGLARLTRQTAGAFDKSGMKGKFDVGTVASNLLEDMNLAKKMERSQNEQEYEKVSSKLEQLNEFENRYYEKHRAELETNGPQSAFNRMQQELENLARHCATNGQVTEAETETLHTFFDCRQNIVELLNNYAPVCDRLAELAKKSLHGEALTEDDAKWIENYGVTLAGFSFYYGNSYEVPRDDFPIVTRIFSNPLTDSMLYAGLARPQALYVIIPTGNALQLYRGAVMTYREFVQPANQPLDDQSWRELVSTGRTPPAPPFTRSFYAEASFDELLKKLQIQSQGEVNYDDMRDLLWQIDSRATEKDLPALLKMLTQAGGEERGDMVEGIGQVISRLPWKPYQSTIIKLLASSDQTLATVAARILIEQPESVDVKLLISEFDQQQVYTRRLCCAVVSRLPQSPTTHSFFVQAVHDPADGVRWQAAVAIETAGWNEAKSQDVLLGMLDDTNEYVAAAAVHSLAQLGVTNVAPALFAELKTALQETNVPIEELEQQSLEITRDLHSQQNQTIKILDPDNLESRLYVSAQVEANVRRMSAVRLPPWPFQLPTHHYDLATALIDAIGDLGYTPATGELFQLRGTDYDVAATSALVKLAPNRLADELIAKANDRELDSYLRERALVTLSTVTATNRVRELVPLLDDTTPIEYSRTPPGPPWRICDRTAETIAIMLGWQARMMPWVVQPQQREEMMKRARAWAKEVN